MNEDPPLRVKRLTATARLPVRADDGSVGYDLHADLPGGLPLHIYAEGRDMVPTGIAVAIEPGLYGRVAPRSGLAAKFGIDVLAGVIDPSYRGEVKVILKNSGDGPFTIQHGDRIAQLVLERVATPAVLEVDDLDDTERGAGGFGSTGV